MRVWSVMYNLIGLLVVLFMLMVLYRDVRVNEAEFEKLRLQYAVDYATGAAFTASFEGGNIGISYEDMQNLQIRPSGVMSVFKSMMAMSYNMSLSEDNLNSFDKYISSAVLAVSDGYYIMEPREVDGELEGVRGGTYELKWGLKHPYSFKYSPNIYVAHNISSQSFVLIGQNPDGSLYRSSGNTNKALQERLVAFNANRKIVYDNASKISTINQDITSRINFSIYKRNCLNSLVSDDPDFETKKVACYNSDTTDDEIINPDSTDFVYLPSVQTTSGINPISKPSFLVTLSGVDFAGTQKMESKSVGGYRIANKIRVLAFTENGRKYYCYESQLDDLSRVEQFYNTAEEAARAGYRPHLRYISGS